MTDRNSFNLKKTSLYVLVGSAHLSALLCIPVLVGRKSGDIVGEIVLLTTITLSFASLCVLPIIFWLQKGRKTSPEDRSEEQVFFRTAGNAAAVGALLALPALFVLAAVCGLTIGIPVPMVGWDSGAHVALISPMAIIIYSIFSGGLLPVIAVVAGALMGSSVWHLKTRQRQRKERFYVESESDEE